LIAVVIIAAVTTLGENLSKVFSKLATNIAKRRCSRASEWFKLFGISSRRRVGVGAPVDALLMGA
jgi:hypothetical protein